MVGPSKREVAWGRGARGERIVGAALEALEPSSFRTLHDRRMPRSRANLDHITVADGRVYTVDAKRYTGAIAVRRGALLIAGRDRSKLLHQALRQRDAVRAALNAAGHADVPVIPVLCFSGVEWPLLFPPRRVGEVRLCSPRGLRRTLGTDAPAGARPGLGELWTTLDRAFPAVVAAGAPAPASATEPRSPGPAPNGGPAPADVAPRAPACACGEPMVRRTRRRDGQAFYGCSAYPACRRTRSMEGHR